MKNKKYFSLRFTFLLSISLLIILSVFSYLRMEGVSRASELQNHGYKVKLELESTFSTVKDAQSNKRGFIITGDSVFYQTFYRNITRLDVKLNSLDSLVKDNPFQVSNMAVLRELIGKRTSSMRLIIDNIPSAKVLIQSDAGGRRLMDRIRNHILKMDAEEDRLLKERNASFNKQVLFVTPVIIFLLLLSAIVIVVLAYYRIMKDLKHSEAMELEREQINKELKEKNDLLNKSEQQLFRFFDNNPVAISVADLVSGKIVSANKGFYNLFDLAEGEVIGRTSDDLKLTSDEENARLIPLIMSHLGDGRTLEELQQLTLEEKQEVLVRLRENMFRNGFEVKYTRKNGESFFAMVYFEVIETGSHTYTITCYQNISERKEAEEKLLHTTTQLLQAQRIAHIGSWERDVKTKKVIWSDELYRIYGFEPGEIDVTIENLAKYDYEIDREKIYTIMDNAVIDKQPFNFDYSIITPQNEVKILNTYGEVVTDENGEVIKVVGTTQDVTERVQMIEKLHENEKVAKAKQQFLANMSHEIRTPMNSIIGFAKVVLRTDLTADQRKYISAIRESGDALLVIINDILDIAKVDAGKMTFDKVPFNLHSSVATSLLMMEGKLKEKNLELVKEFDESIPEIIVGDPTRLRQIFLNLLSNAVKFTDTGTVTMSINKLEEDEKNIKLKFTVTDTGIGIPENEQDKIFESFEQAYETSSKYGGTGLGLAIIKNLVELQGGSIDLKSTVGEGSSFSVVMEFGKSVIDSAVETEQTFHKGTAPANIKILVAEDHEMNQLLIKLQLLEFGFEVDIAENGKIAIEKLKTNNYDMILMDIQMPEMNGFETTKYIRNKMKSNIPIIALTADVTSTDIEKSRDFGMNDYLSKPIDDKILYNKIVLYARQKGSLNDELSVSGDTIQLD